jgi:alpha-ketoglutarate-dependent taurine dioxygenase
LAILTPVSGQWSLDAMSKLEVRELHPGFGVEVLGVEPKVPLDADVIAQLRQLFDTKGLVVLRDADIDRRFQNYLSQILIGVDSDEAVALADTERAKRNLVVSNKEPEGNAPSGRLLYHSDFMWSEDIFRLLSLYGVEVEEPTSPTMFVSAEHAWNTLPDDLRARVEGKFAIQGQDADYAARSGAGDDVLVAKFADEETIRLPIGHKHPRTGATLLFVAQQFTQNIDGLEKEESEALLEELFDHLYRPENVLEHHWRERDLVLWDNIALQHARPNILIEGPARTLRKTFAPLPKLPASSRPQFTTVGS